jgi:hypothetical protein
VVSASTGAGLKELRANLWCAAASSTNATAGRTAGSRDLRPEIP